MLRGLIRLIRLTELGGSASVDALVVRQAPGLDALAGSDGGAARAARVARRSQARDPVAQQDVAGPGTPLIDADEQEVALLELLARMPIEPTVRSTRWPRPARGAYSGSRPSKPTGPWCSNGWRRTSEIRLD